GPDDAVAPVCTITLPAGLSRSGQVKLPAGWTVVADNGRQITIRAGLMPVGSVAEVVIAVRAASAGVYAVTAAAQSDTPDGHLAANRAEARVTVAASPERPVPGGGGTAGSPDGGGSNDSLPVTGAAVTGVGWLGVALLTVGCMLLAAVGCRRRAE